jgi:hypothetical protein
LKKGLTSRGVKMILTIDKAQGMDCDTVILSCTKQTAEKG